MEERNEQRILELLKQESELVKERRGKLAKSSKNENAELQEKRRYAEIMKRKLDESVGDSGLHDEMTTLEAIIKAEEDLILDELEPGYVESYNRRMAAIKGH